MAKSDIVTSVVFIIFSIIIYIGSLNFPEVPNNRIAGPAFYPQIIAIALILTSIALIIQSVPKLKMKQEIERLDKKKIIRVGIVFTATILYAVSMKVLGFVIATLLYFCILSAMMQKKLNVLQIITGSVIITGVVYAVFIMLLKASLPRGILF